MLLKPKVIHKNLIYTRNSNKHGCYSCKIKPNCKLIIIDGKSISAYCISIRKLITKFGYSPTIT